MSYVPPSADAVNFSWEGAAPYASPPVDDVSFSWETPSSGVTGVGRVSRLLGSVVAQGMVVEPGYVARGSAVVSSLLGHATAQAHVVVSTSAVTGQATIASMMRSVEAQARVGAIAASGTVSGWLTAQGSATRVFQASTTTRTPFGSVNGQGVSMGSPWASLGLPLPSVSGYSYTADRGLVRTEMDSGTFIQRRRWVKGYRTATLSFVVPLDDLQNLESLLNDFAYDWFNMPLVTEDNETYVAQDHLVRVKDNPTFGNTYGDTIEVSLQVDVQ